MRELVLIFSGVIMVLRLNGKLSLFFAEATVLVFYGWFNKSPQTWWFKQYKFSILRSEVRSLSGAHWARFRDRQGFYIPSGVFRGESILLPFPAKGWLLSLAHSHFSIFKAKLPMSGPRRLMLPPLWLCSAFFYFEGPCDYTGPTCIIQNNIHFLRSANQQP